MRRFGSTHYLSIATVALAAFATGCVQGPFTEPAKVTLYEDRRAPSTSAPAPAAPGPAGSGYHVVTAGDTVYAVANRHRVPIRRLIELNGLQAPYVLRPGRKLQLPASPTHVVQAGDTIYGISQRYGVAISSLVRLNGIEPPYTIVTGSILRLPEKLETAIASPPAKRAVSNRKLPALADSQRPPAARPAAAPSSATPAPQPVRPVAVAAPRVRPVVPQPPPRAGRTFLLPVRGRVISRFGPQGRGLRNDGINIAVAEGTPVRAAENGIVVYSGNALLGFGNMLLIRHADGYMTAYGHNRSLSVARGDVVRRGQVIAVAGSTGNVSTPQLHFEIRKGKTAVNPAKYLPNLAAHGFSRPETG